MSWTKLDTGGKVYGRKKATAITAIKEEVRLRDWAEQIEAQQVSGMTVQKWCAEIYSSGLTVSLQVSSHY